MSSVPQDSLGSILLRYNLVSLQEVHEALELQKQQGGRLGENLVRLGYLQEDALAWCLANQLNVPCVSSIDIRPETLDSAAAERVPADFAWEHHILPYLLAGQELTVIADDPLDRAALGKLEAQTGLKLNVAVSTTSEILAALKVVYGERREERVSGGEEDLDARATLESWLRQLQTQGTSRVLLEVTPLGAQARARSRGRSGGPSSLTKARFDKLMEGLRDLTGIRSNTALTVRPFLLGGLQGTVAFGPPAGGVAAVISLDRQSLSVEWPVEWGAAIRSRVRGPGLWVLGVGSSRFWAPACRAFTAALSPERRVLSLDGLLADARLDRVAAGSEVVSHALALEPDLLLVPAAYRGALLEQLRGGLPDCTVVLQVAARTPVRALQVLRSFGFAGPELAEVLVGVLCINGIEEACRSCAGGRRESGPAGLEVVSRGCPACGGTGVAPEVPVLHWREMSRELEKALADERPIAGLNLLFAPGPLPGVKEQVQRYVEDGTLSTRALEMVRGLIG